MNRDWWRCLLFVVLVSVLPGCSQKQDAQGPVYRPEPRGVVRKIHHLAVHPLHNPAKLSEVYQPLITYLNRELPEVRFELEASRDYASYEGKIGSRVPELLLPNPWQTLQAMNNGYKVIAMAGSPEDFKGIFVVRKDSGIKKPADLKGKAVSYPSPTALAACIMPQYFLHQKGLNVMKDIENRYVGSQESSIMNVFYGQTAAGATWPPPWRAFQKSYPLEASQLEVIWETPHLVNNSVMVRNDLSLGLQIKIQAALVRLHDIPEGRGILSGMETSRFSVAAESDYELVRRYVATFEQEIRPVGNKP